MSTDAPSPLGGGRFLFGFLLTLILLAGCTSLSDQSRGYPAPSSASEKAYPAPARAPAATVIQRTLVFPLPPHTAPPPRPGQASISGLLFSISTLAPIPETLFYLTPATGEEHDRMPILLAGPDVTRGDVTTRTTDNGVFQLDSIPPGEYFLIVASPGSWREAVRSEVDPSPLLISLSAGQRLALGVVSVIWP
jgi:hypothetical protein